MSEAVEPKLNEEIVKALHDTSGQWTPHCLRPDDLMNLIEQGDRSRIARRAQSHLATCAYCRNERLRMEAILQEAAQARELYLAGTQPSSATPTSVDTSPRFRWQRTLVPALTTACMILTTVIVWQATTRSRESALKAEIARLSDELQSQKTELNQTKQEFAQMGNTVKSIETERNLAQQKSNRLQNENAALTMQLKQKDQQLTSVPNLGQEYELPNVEQRSKLEEDIGNTVGGGSERSLTLLQPAPKSTLTTNRPTFRWKSVPHATHYQLTLWNTLRPAETQTIERLTATEWTPERPLTPGAVYEWGVTAMLPNGEEESSRPSRFLILKIRRP
jgi:hypothetical protein